MTSETKAAAETSEAPSARPRLGSQIKVDWHVVGPALLITLVGLALRLWGIGWSLPNATHPLATYHPDELVNLGAAQQADIPHLKFDIGFYNYGTLYFYLVSFAQTFGRGWGLIPTTVPLPDAGRLEQSIHAAPELAALFLAGRLVTVLLGTATIPVCFALGNRLFGRTTGFIAALLYALLPFAVIHAHFLTVDVPATFFVVLTLLWSAKMLTSQTWADYGLAALWTGFAAATKYTCALVFVAPLTAHLLNRNPESCSIHRKAQFFIYWPLTVLAFLLACPGPILNLDAFWDGLPNYPGSGVRYELFEHSRQGHGDLFLNTGPGWWYHLVVSLPYALGWPLLLLTLAGVIYACARRSKGDWILLAFLLVYYGATGASAVRFARYMIPLFPVFCVLTARLVADPPKQFLKERARAFQIIGGMVILFTALYTFTLTAQMSRTDPRDAAAAYLDRTLPQGASVGFAKIPWFFSPPLSPLFGAQSAPERAKSAQLTTRYRLRMPAYEWDAAVLSPPPSAVIVSNIEDMHALMRLHQAAPIHFVQSAPPYYRRHVFRPGQIIGLPPNRTIIPEDLLYIMPTISVYIRSNMMDGPPQHRLVAPFSHQPTL